VSGGAGFVGSGVSVAEGAHALATAPTAAIADRLRNSRLVIFRLCDMILSLLLCYGI
jgi:hypothetical protein